MDFVSSLFSNISRSGNFQDGDVSAFLSANFNEMQSVLLKHGAYQPYEFKYNGNTFKIWYKNESKLFNIQDEESFRLWSSENKFGFAIMQNGKIGPKIYLNNQERNIESIPYNWLSILRELNHDLSKKSNNLNSEGVASKIFSDTNNKINIGESFECKHLIKKSSIQNNHEETNLFINHLITPNTIAENSHNYDTNVINNLESNTNICNDPKISPMIGIEEVNKNLENEFRINFKEEKISEDEVLLNKRISFDYNGTPISGKYPLNSPETLSDVFPEWWTWRQVRQYIFYTIRFSDSNIFFKKEDIELKDLNGNVLEMSSNLKGTTSFTCKIKNIRMGEEHKVKFSVLQHGEFVDYRAWPEDTLEFVLVPFPFNFDRFFIKKIYFNFGKSSSLMHRIKDLAVFGMRLIKPLRSSCKII